MSKNRTFQFVGFVIINEVDQFFNSKNGKFTDDLLQHQIYWDYKRAEEVAAGYGLRVVEVDIDLKVIFPK